MSALYHQPSNPSAKICTQCHTEKPLENFGRDRTQSSGYKPACKECLKYRRKHPRVVQQPLFVTTKVCYICKVEKSLDQFGLSKRAKDGLRVDCKECRVIEGKQRWLKSHPERKYLPPATNGVKICRTCRQEKPIDQFYIDKRAKDKHGTQCKECIHEREYVRNREQTLARNREQWEKNSAKYLATHKKWYQANKLKVSELSRRRVARQRAASVGRVSYRRIIARDGYTCYICGKAIDPTIKDRGPNSLSFDHEKPLAGIGNRKGTHTEDNIHPAHRVCNLRKGIKLLDELNSHHRRGV